MSKKASVWTQFWDMNSGGGRKEKWDRIYIEAPEDEAKSVFYAKFGHNPDRVSCTCCGSDYSIDSGPLDQLTAYHRGCAFLKVEGETGGGHYVEEPDTRYSFSKEHVPLEDYLKREEVKVIYAKDIEDSERRTDVPEEGYVWR